jgi:hypothetical protein
MSRVGSVVAAGLIVGACSAAGEPASLTITNDQWNAVLVRVELDGAPKLYRFEPHQAAVVLEREAGERADLDVRVTVLAESCEILSVTPVRVTRHEVLSVADPNPESKLSFGPRPPESARRASPITDPCPRPR